MDSTSAIWLIVLLFTVTVLLIVVLKAKFALERAHRKLEDQFAELNRDHNQLKTKSEPLWRYEGILKIDREIAKRKRMAQIVEARSKQESEALINAAKKESREMRAKIREFLERTKRKATETMEVAKTQAQQLQAQAEENARAVAGDALDAKNNAAEYTKTAKAMKNLIKGYGDEYLIPNQSTLDDLAEDFSHKEAGRELSAARKQTRSMIQYETAASCDYVETHRRKTAIEFVVDAFNGKVDSILTRVKHDNYGKLAQEIKDAYQTVNHNGQAFRNAVINELYLANRLNELKWAVAVHELKLAEKEEQRQIREQIRDEEKARKEYEKAIKQAEKEERDLQKAFKIARKELESSTEAERANFEAKLAELTEKLTEAEAKAQRAMSMAQQTRRGHVYVISNIGSFGQDIFKIGMTRRLEPLDRVKELGDASVPFDFDVHAIISAEDAPTLENELHKEFTEMRVNKVNTRKEFFNVGIVDIRKMVEKLGVEAHWTMKAEAHDYRESLAETHRTQFAEVEIA